MKKKYYDRSYELIEQKNNILLLFSYSEDSDEQYCVVNKSDVDVIRDNYTRLSEQYLVQLERDEKKLSMYEYDELTNAQLHFEQAVLDQNINTEQWHQCAVEAYKAYLATVKDNIQSNDWRDSTRNQEEFFQAYKKQYAKEQALEKIAGYKNDKAYEKTVPLCLKDKSMFVAWKYFWSDKNERIIKLPINPRNNRAADTSDYKTWSTFEKACEIADKNNYHGVGIVFNGRGLMGIDIDDCFNDGELAQKARDIVEEVNSYTEISPSGKGIHILCFGNLPSGDMYKRKDDLEMYDTGRFFTLTGKCLDGKFRKIPARASTQQAIDNISQKYLKRESIRRKSNVVEEILTIDDDVFIKKIMQSKKGTDFINMYEKGLPPMDEQGAVVLGCRKDRDRDGTLDNTDWSKVDFHFCGVLAFYNPPKEQVDRIYRNSKLMRTKWDTYRGSQTYGEITISQAYNTRASVYDHTVAKIQAIGHKYDKKISKKIQEME